MRLLPDPLPQKPEAEPTRDVLLALEELAREQAAELSRQNEELRQQNETLARADRNRAEFLTVMSHELRTPLTAVIGYSEVMLERIAGPISPDQQRYLEAIHSAGRNLLGMINDLLDLAKIDAGRMEMHLEPMDLRLAAEQAIDLARSMSMRMNQTLTFHADNAPCLGDPQRVRQVALNLVSNAVKFTPSGGCVTVTVSSGNDFAELTVRDTGVGIDPAHHAFIFESFRQIEGSSSSGYQGTGLGLSLVKKFTDAMGGSVSVESQLGEGATFRVRLPACPAEAL